MLLAPWALWLVLGIISPGIDEWNPRIESNAAVIGSWKGDGYELHLDRDSSYALFSDGNKATGRWKQDDWNLSLTADDRSVRIMRFVEDGGELLLLPEPPQAAETTEPGPIMKRE